MVLLLFGLLLQRSPQLLGRVQLELARLEVHRMNHDTPYPDDRTPPERTQHLLGSPPDSVSRRLDISRKSAFRLHPEHLNVKATRDKLHLGLVDCDVAPAARRL